MKKAKKGRQWAAMSKPNISAVAEKVFGPSEDQRPTGCGGDNPEKWDYSLEMANYVSRLKNYENEGQIGRDTTGVWTPHDSPEGGTKTVGYGHKLSEFEDPDEKFVIETVLVAATATFTR